MKDKFSEFYETPNLEELWTTCHFIFDTNVFLNLYKRYPKKIYERFIDILEQKIPDRIWMPHQIGLEYQKNRIQQVKDKEREFKNVIASIKGLKCTLTSNYGDQLKKMQTDAHFIDLNHYIDSDLVDEKSKEINEKFKEIDEIIDFIKENINEDLNFLDTDIINDKLVTIFAGKIGDNYPPLKLKEIYDEGVYRYACRIPPGYEDRNKKSGNPYGDLILWHQIMDYAQKNRIAVIFVTDEEKKDWWHVYQYNKEKEFIRPDHHLLQEFTTTGQEFYIVRFSDFLDKTKEYLDADVETEVIEAVKVIEELQDLEEELEESEKAELSGSESLGSPSQLGVQMELRQQEMIRAAGSISALQGAVETARRQQEMIRAVSFNPGIQLALDAARSQQEMITALSINPSIRAAAKQPKRKGKQDDRTEDNQEEDI